MTKEEKTALVAECRASGMTAREWCQLKGVFANIKGGHF